MRELATLLGGLDPTASQSLRVITHFDILMRSGVGVGSLARAAAALTGSVTGVHGKRRALRVDPDGRTLPAGDPPQGSVRGHFEDGVVWLERAGTAESTDAMVAERLAIAVEFAERRASDHRSAVEDVVDSSLPGQEREEILARLGLAPSAAARVLVGDPQRWTGRPRSGVTVTAHGLMGVVVAPKSVDLKVDRAGVGPVVPARNLPESFELALLAYRLSDAAHPVVDASELGVLGPAALAVERATDPHPDVASVQSLDERSRAVARALCRHGSIRAAANSLGLHHSSVQARLTALIERLGYDPRTTPGSARFQVADLVARLHP